MKRVQGPLVLCGIVGLMVIAGFCVAVSAQEAFLPGGLDTAGVDRIVPDTPIFVDPEGNPSLDNWEPYSSVLGTEVFLIESNAFAEDTPDPGVSMQRFGLALQKVGGGPVVESECFYADAGEPYKGPINNYRQNGNPGRVAGDTRPGATHIITGAETSADEFDPFRDDGRWDLGLVRMGRYATVQTFEIDPGTLAQTPASKAFDAINGRIEDGDLSGIGGQIGRFGGDVACLDNGNFVVVVDDRSGLHNAGAGTATTAVIVGPDGSIVKDSFVIVNGDIWSNVCAFKGGFCVREGGLLRFFNNAGDLQGEVDQADAGLVDENGAPVTFDRGRGDGTRIASHINSPYVFLAGASGLDVRLAVWDSRDRTYVAQIHVNEVSTVNGGSDEKELRRGWDRVNLAVDALNRVVVAYEVKNDDVFPAQQTVARVIELDAASGELRHMTPSFFPFVNFSLQFPEGGAPPIRTFRPTVAMTTKEVCIAAKGEINSENLPENGADSLAQTNFFTVFKHPDPKDDPTPGLNAGLFIRGDTNDDGKPDLSDSVFLLGHLFLGGPRWTCEEGADINNDGNIDISDAVTLLGHLFLGNPAPPPPFPTCGADPGGEKCPSTKCNT